MDTNRLEDVCKQLRLAHIPSVIETAGFEIKEDWLLFLLKNELKCPGGIKNSQAFQTGQISSKEDAG